MNKLLKILVILAELYLSACSPQLPASPPPSITAGPLDSAQAYLMRGDQYSGIKDFEHAIADYGQAIRLKPDYAEAYNNRGVAYSIFGKVDMPKAIADFSEAIRLRPAYAYAYNNRGDAYMASGYPDQALSDLTAPSTFNPTSRKRTAIAVMLICARGISSWRWTISVAPGRIPLP